MRPKDDRNKKLVRLRRQNPTKWSWAELGRYFKISTVMAYKIYQRDQDRF